jgi:hypothetical protein
MDADVEARVRRSFAQQDGYLHAGVVAGAVAGRSMWRR